MPKATNGWWRTVCLSMLAALITTWVFIFTLTSRFVGRDDVSAMIDQALLKRGDQYREDRQMILRELQTLRENDEKITFQLDRVLDKVRAARPSQSDAN